MWIRQLAACVIGVALLTTGCVTREGACLAVEELSRDPEFQNSDRLARLRQACRLAAIAKAADAATPNATN